MLIQKRGMDEMLKLSINATRTFVSTASHLEKSSSKRRSNQWNLPDLNKLPGGFKGKIYNKRNWEEHTKQHTTVKTAETETKSIRVLRPPPENWRNDKSLPNYMRAKYALREKQITTDLSNVKKLSPVAQNAIRELHNKYPEELPTKVLADLLQVSPVAISKILKSKWKSTLLPEEFDKKQRKWEKEERERSTKRIMNKGLSDFFAHKESQLGLELPEFLKVKLTSYYKIYGMEPLQENFDRLKELHKKLDGTKTDKTKVVVDKIDALLSIKDKDDQKS